MSRYTDDMMLNELNQECKTLKSLVKIEGSV